MHTFPEFIVAWTSVVDRFYTGPGIVPKSISGGSHYIVLIINGREPSKVDVARRWLNHITQRFSDGFCSVVVVLHGNEQCNNSWISQYIKPSSNVVKALFVTYDIPESDDRYFFQWPLGVATFVLLLFSLLTNQLAIFFF